MHSNFVVATDDPDANSAVVVTAANLTRSNAQRHYNASVAIGRPRWRHAREGVRSNVAGDFKRPVAEATIDLSDGSACTVLCGANGETLEGSADVIDQAAETVNFAMFTLAIGNEAFDALLRALARGVPGPRRGRWRPGGSAVGRGAEATRSRRGRSIQPRSADGRRRSDAPEDHGCERGTRHGRNRELEHCGENGA